MKLFEPAELGNITLKNRIIRSATYEGMCDSNGFPAENYKKLYVELAKNGVGCIITGFAYISPDSKAMQPNQAGIDNPFLFSSSEKPLIKLMRLSLSHH